jgi:hypothetical protein
MARESFSQDFPEEEKVQINNVVEILSSEETRSEEEERVEHVKKKTWGTMGTKEFKTPYRGSPQFEETQGVVSRQTIERGERSPRKRRKHNRETISKKEAA